MDMILSRSFNARGDGKWKFDIPEIDVHATVTTSDTYPPTYGLSRDYHTGGVLHIPGQAPMVLNDIGSDSGLYSDIGDANLRTKWMARPVTASGKMTLGFKVYSPDGITYDITQTYDKDLTVVSSVAVQKDLFGNQIEYRKTASSISITANDGRSATVYLTAVTDYGTCNGGKKDEGKSKQILNRLEVSDGQLGTRIWSYEYAPRLSQNYSVFGGGAKNYDYRLIKAIQPDSTAWNYTYGAPISTSDSSLCNMTSARLPTGATVTYTQASTMLAVNTRTVSGNNIENGVWSYAYEQNISGFGVRSNFSKKTIVTSPSAITAYEFNWSTSGTAVAIWGEPKSIKVYSLTDTALTTPLRSIDYEYYIRSSRVADSRVASVDYTKHEYFAALSKVTVDGKFITQYSALDPYWNWTTKTETTGTRSRTTTTTYKNQFPTETQNMFIGELVDYQTISGNSKTWWLDNTFNTLGQLEQSIDQGIYSDYSYDSSGNLYQYTYYNNLGSQSVYYTDYYRGQPQLETYPGGILVRREINDAGTVAWEEDGEGNRTSFEYDKLNRVTKISPPGISATDIQYNFSASLNTIFIVRNGYTKEIELDGLGRKTLTTESGKGVSTYVNYKYDVAGRQTFVSQPSSFFGETKGIQTDYDALNRVVKETDTATNAATSYCSGTGCVLDQYRAECDLTTGAGCNSMIKYEEFLSKYDDYFRIKNALGRITEYKKQGFGSADQTWSTQIVQPEGITTDIVRNVLGDVESVTQGGITRSYSYYSNSQRLHKITEPERGIVTHWYDVGGNLKMRQVGSMPYATYAYDALNRLSSITYSDTTPKIEYTYFDNGLTKTMNHGAVKRSYNYTPFGALDDETLIVDTKSFTLDYGYNTDGYLDSLKYPSGIDLIYDVDDLGRITKVGTATKNFATDITYYPTGTIHEMTYGNGVKTTYALNSRQMVEKITAQIGTSGRLKMGFTYDAVTNVSSITDYLTATNTISSLTYDGVNRLKTAVSPKWGTASFNYDTKGNITSLNMGSLGSLSYLYDATNRLASVSGVESRSFSYDSFGNVTKNSKHDFAYNAASRMTKVKDPSTQATLIDYVYDGEGIKAIEIKRNSALYTFYSQAGDLLYEKDFITGEESTYVQLGNQNIAKINTTMNPPSYDGYMVDNTPAYSSSGFTTITDSSGGYYKNTYSQATVASTGTYLVFRPMIFLDGEFSIKAHVYSGPGYCDFATYKILVDGTWLTVKVDHNTGPGSVQEFDLGKYWFELEIPEIRVSTEGCGGKPFRFDALEFVQTAYYSGY